jgi:ATP-binding cassette subfamily D (ALD) long-chain fatty acid import protein
VIKYLWSAAGYGLIAVPLLITRKRGEGRDPAANDGVVADRTESKPSRSCSDMHC